MISQVAATLVLVCAGKPLPDATVDAGSFAFMKIPVSDAMLAAFKADPPVAKMTFAGEAVGQREWIIGGSPDPAGMKVLRLTKSNDPLSPFAFRAGMVTEQSGGPAFKTVAVGKCDLRQQDIAPKGSD